MSLSSAPEWLAKSIHLHSATHTVHSMWWAVKLLLSGRALRPVHYYYYYYYYYCIPGVKADSSQSVSQCQAKEVSKELPETTEVRAKGFSLWIKELLTAAVTEVWLRDIVVFKCTNFSDSHQNKRIKEKKLNLSIPRSWGRLNCPSAFSPQCLKHTHTHTHTVGTDDAPPQLTSCSFSETRLPFTFRKITWYLTYKCWLGNIKAIWYI